MGPGWAKVFRRRRSGPFSKRAPNSPVLRALGFGDDVGSHGKVTCAKRLEVDARLTECQAIIRPAGLIE